MGDKSSLELKVGIFAFIGLFSLFLGIIGELIKMQRKLMEEMYTNMKELTYKK